MRSCTVPTLLPLWPLMLWCISLLARTDLPICELNDDDEPRPVLLEVADVPLLELPVPDWLELFPPGAPLDERSRDELDEFAPELDEDLPLVLLPLLLDLSLSSFAKA